MSIVFAANDVLSTVNLYHATVACSTLTGSVSAELSSSDAALTLLKCLHMSFTESDSTAAKVRGLFQYVYPLFDSAAPYRAKIQENERGRFTTFGLEFESPAKAIHRLHAPQEVSTEACCVWIDAYLAERADGFLIDGICHAVWNWQIGDIIRAMESVERYSDGVALAEQFKKSYPGVPVIEVEASRAQGRCLTKLGRDSEAESAFEAAIAEAVRVGHTYHELLARRDYIEYVLDPAGRREEQLAALGGTLKALALEPSEYDGVLGVVSGLDASAAVCASGEGACMTAPTW